jgi:hypothetical protein
MAKGFSAAVGASADSFVLFVDDQSTTGSDRLPICYRISFRGWGPVLRRSPPLRPFGIDARTRATHDQKIRTCRGGESMFTTRRQFLAAAGSFALTAVGKGRADAAMGPNDKFDLVIKGGDVLDPSQSLRGRRDIGIRFGVIEALEADIPGRYKRSGIGLATGDPHHPDRVRGCRRSSRRRLRRDAGAAGRQCHRLYPVRIFHGREMAGAAQGDRAALSPRRGVAAPGCGALHRFGSKGLLGTTPAARITLRTPAAKPSSRNTIIPQGAIPSKRSSTQPSAAPTTTAATSSAESRKPRAIADGSADGGCCGLTSDE